MVAAAKQRAKRQGVPFALRPEDITIPPTCPALGIPLRVSSGIQSDNSPSIDRLIPATGYVKGNVLVVSCLANRMKNSGSLEHMRALVDFYELVLPERRRWRKDPA